MSEHNQESWEHYSKLVLDVLERHDEHLNKLEEEISQLQKDARHELEKAVAGLRSDMKILKEILDGDTELVRDRLLTAEKGLANLSERVSAVEAQTENINIYKNAVIGAIIFTVISLIFSLMVPS